MQKQMYIFAFLVILQEHLQLQYTFLAYCSIKMHVILNLTCIFFFFCFKAQDDLLSCISIKILLIQVISV